jgi:hypothetical protein
MAHHPAGTTALPTMSAHETRVMVELMLAEPQPEREWDWYAAAIWLGAIAFSLLAWVGVVLLVVWGAG